MSTRSPLRLFIASSALSCISALVVAWPVAIHAEDPEAAADAANAEELPPDATQIGDVVAATQIVKDEKTNRHSVRLVAMNTSKEHEAQAKIEVNVLKWENSAESRVSPPPQVAWERTIKLVLPPGARDVREIPLNPQLEKALTKLEKLQKRMEDGDPNVTMPRTFVSYEASVVAPIDDSANSAETATASANEAPAQPANGATAAL